jgi:PRTRC genetic system ThiF family protein
MRKTTTKNNPKSLKGPSRSKARQPKLPADPKEAVHYTEGYIINPMHPVTVNLIGCGGTGSQMLNNLARMNSALKALGHTGLFVRTIDPDIVTEANMGRQLFSKADVGHHKCMVLAGRINRFFGTDWEGMPALYTEKSKVPAANITISCVDSGAARLGIKKGLYAAGKKEEGNHTEPYNRTYYWMDFGNTMAAGQVVMGTLQDIRQPKDEVYITKERLLCIGDLHPDIFKDKPGEERGPSCSMAEALGRQDLTINSALANYGWGILWKMFREAKLKYHGGYLNQETMSSNPIKV